MAKKKDKLKPVPLKLLVPPLPPSPRGRAGGLVGGRARAKLIRQGKLNPQSWAAGGRPKVPKPCAKCGVQCTGSVEAKYHCRKIEFRKRDWPKPGKK